MGDPVATKSRLTTLDALRGLAVFAMIEQHVGIWLWEGPAPGMTRLDYPGLVAFNAGSAIGAPIFFALAGAGTAMLCHRRPGPGLDGGLVRRGLLLYAFGMLVNLATPSWFSWGSFFALHMMGVGVALAPLWRRMSDRFIVALMFLVLFATPVVQWWLGTPDDLTNPRMRDTTLPGGALRLVFIESQYSLLPWISTYLAGFFTGRCIERDDLRPVVRLGAVIFAIAALGHLAVWLTGAEEPDLLWRAFRFKLGWFPPSLAIVMGLLGPALLIIVAAVKRDRRRPLRDDHPLVTLGRISLTVFIVHAPLFRELSRPLGLWSALSAGPTLVAIASFTIACLVLSRAWSRHGYRYGAEWLMRRLADLRARR